MSNLEYFVSRNDQEQRKILEILFMIETNGVRSPDSIWVDDSTGCIEMSWHEEPYSPLLSITYSSEDKDYGIFACEDWESSEEAINFSFCLDEDEEAWEKIREIVPRKF
jgi:hypothetical protein